MWNPADPVVIPCGDLNQHLDECCIVDCRFDLSRHPWGRAAYFEGHIPGARYAHLDEDLADLSQRGLGRHPLPDEAWLSRLFGRLEIREDRPLVVYDQGSGAIAARLWWMARNAGHSSVFLLDGGYAQWVADGYPVESGSVAPDSATYPAVCGHMPTISADDLTSALSAGSIILVDARDERRYAGIEEPIDRIAGHIPGAVNLPFSQNLSATGRWKTTTQLQQTWSRVLGDDWPPEKPVVLSCGSGVTACHNIAALERLGVRSVLFAPSYSGWLERDDAPIATCIPDDHDL